MSRLVTAEIGINGTSGSANNLIRFNDSISKFEVFKNGFWFADYGTYWNVDTTGKSRQVFNYSSDAGQNFTVPSGVTHIYAKVWGAGGGPGGSGGWGYGAPGGPGGHTRGIIPVTGGQTLVMVVPRGGFGGQTAGGWPGGGAYSTSGGNYGSTGGGYAGIFNGAFAIGNQILMAGGGGGGGASRGGGGNQGGSGGGLQGVDGESPFNGHYTYRGRGGTQTAGGVGGGISGGSFQGGQASAYGGGGGGGLFGGSGGSYIEDRTMGGGGGGSGFIATNVIMGETFVGSYRTPYAVHDPDIGHLEAGYVGVKIAHGGFDAINNSTQQGAGGPGRIVIYF
jgi:hypothetical protein